ncbi:hypothetical protein BV22DRAFT_1134024 [Leucogyrophana mollusca]|uniref:Uncharacterized protein n=1 Tax=Leucogyrophana mollusca TaxID=85980 RepID=A0ACB8B372_9AGAM|nr:hypothetical protein BV22DRAFT_1134024 [Leucogyrophana mollusca]
MAVSVPIATTMASSLGDSNKVDHMRGPCLHYFAPKLGKGATTSTSYYASSVPSGNDNTPPMPTKEHAYAAALASQSLLGKLGSAFCEALLGSSGSSLTSAGHGHEKGK